MDEALEEYEVEGQLNIFDYLYPEEQQENTMIAVSRVFAAAVKQMNVTEWKTFIFALCNIRWKDETKETVYLEKQDLIRVLGLTEDTEHASVVLRRSIKNLPKHSFIEFKKSDNEWNSGMFINSVTCRKNLVRIDFTPRYLPLFQNLNRDNNYITMWAADLLKMKSERSILFYEDLRLHSDTRKTNTKIYSTRQIKEMFGIPKDGKGSYMRKDGHFDRRSFEMYVLAPLCEDLQKSEMLHLNVNEDGKCYRKIKKGHRIVLGYEFSWTISNRPAVATAEEVQEIREAVDADPKVLKVAKDIVKGEKNKTSEPKKTKKSSFHDFEDRPIDFKEIERKVLNS